MQFKAILLALCLTIVSVSGNAETLVFQTDEISIDLPAGWTVIERHRFQAGAEKGDYRSEFQNLVKNNKNFLFGALRNYPPIGVTPGIYGHSTLGRIVDFRKAGNSIIDFVRRNVRNFQILKQAEIKTIGEFEALHIRYRYSVEANGIENDIEEWLWLIANGPRYLSISGGVAFGADADALRQIEAAVNSIRKVRSRDGRVPASRRPQQGG